MHNALAQGGLSLRCEKKEKKEKERTNEWTITFHSEDLSLSEDQTNTCGHKTKNQ